MSSLANFAAAQGRDLNAEYDVLERFDYRRSLRGHDYGGGQRKMELVRRRWQLEALGRELPRPTHAELLAAFMRVCLPKLKRIERESYRRSTPATQRTLATYRQLMSDLTTDARLERMGQ